MKKPIVFFVFILLIIVNMPSKAQNVGSPAPDFTLNLVDGGTFTLSQYKGKVVLLYFFGNGCPFCKESGPLVQGIYNTYKNDPNFKAVGLDTWDSSSDVESVTEFRDFTGITFPLGLKANSVKLDYNYTYDRLAVVDQSGVLVRKMNTAAINDINGTSAEILSLLSSTAIENISDQKNAFSIYAAQGSGVLHVDYNNDKDAEVQLAVYDIIGRARIIETFSAKAGSYNMSFDISEFENGIYLYTFRRGSKLESGKLLIRQD